MFWCGVSLAGICLYFTPGLNCVVDGWQVTLRTKFAPTLGGSIASWPLPSRRCGKRWDAGCVSISAMERRKFMIRIDSFQSISLSPSFELCNFSKLRPPSPFTFECAMTTIEHKTQQRLSLPRKYTLDWIEFNSLQLNGWPMSHHRVGCSCSVLPA